MTKFFRHVCSLQSLCKQGCVVTIGNFDGVHSGHQTLIKRLKQEGEKLKLPTVVISFEPQPKEFFTCKKNLSHVPRLMGLREKFFSLAQFSIDYFLCLHFNENLAQTDALSFLQDILIEQLHMQSIIMGDDFRFGAGQQGDIHFLQRYAKENKFHVIPIVRIHYLGLPISSTRIRKALQDGEMNLANKMLDKPFFLMGKVVHSAGRGKGLGFPTANIFLAKQPPLKGVFVVQVVLNKKTYSGVASIGNRPTYINDGMWLEVYILDFNRDIYGCCLQVNFLHKIRDEEVFQDSAHLIEKIKEDVQVARKFFQ